MKRIIILIIAICWTYFIWHLLTAPGTELPSIHLFRGADKLVHLLLFATLSYLWIRAFGVRLLTLMIVIIIASIFGHVTEWLQLDIPGRSSSFYDQLANFTGVILGAYLAARRQKRLHHR